MWILQYIQLAIILLISIGIHEFAHAYSSFKLGDPTPKIQGRLTPNPLKHVDPIGFIAIFLIGFWRGKPVQINPSYYKKPLKDELIVALAGPASNIAMSIIGILIIFIFAKTANINLTELMEGSSSLVISFWMLFTMINIALAVFNMLPIPPLDGFRLVKVLIPKRAQKIERYSMYILVGLALLIIFPGTGNGIWNFIVTISSKIFHILFVGIGQIFY